MFTARCLWVMAVCKNDPKSLKDVLILTRVIKGRIMKQQKTLSNMLLLWKAHIHDLQVEEMCYSHRFSIILWHSSMTMKRIQREEKCHWVLSFTATQLWAVNTSIVQPDLVPTDSHLTKLNDWLQGQQFISDEELKANISGWLSDQVAAFFDEGTGNLCRSMISVLKEMAIILRSSNWEMYLHCCALNTSYSFLLFIPASMKDNLTKNFKVSAI